jgi:hypothetical protein
MTEPKSRMAAMRLRAKEAFAEGSPEDLSGFSTTALWEVARVAHKKGNRHALARVLVELFDRTDPNDGTNVPIELRIHLPGCSVSDTPLPVSKPVSDTATDTLSAVSDTPSSDQAPVSDTALDTETTVSDTLLLALEPSAPPPKAKDYPDSLKARAVAMHHNGESRETIRAMLIEQHGKAPDVTNWSKTIRRWEESIGAH